MKTTDNGGAQAIKGFNYQKSVIMLIAVLHYLNVDDFEIYVETEDDIVVKISATKTYIQVKGKKLSIAAITKRENSKSKEKMSVLEKNLEKDDKGACYYKIVALDFAASEKYLKETTPRIFKKGAKVYEYTPAGQKELMAKLPTLDPLKLKNSRLVLTSFGANLQEALERIMGIMASVGLSVDNNYGKTALEEMCLEIDQRSEMIIDEDSDIEKKKFTPESLSNIFSHSYKEVYLNDLLMELGYGVTKKVELKTRRVRVRAVYGSFCTEAKRVIEKLDNLSSMSAQDIIEHVLSVVDFKTVSEELDRETIVLEALSNVLFEKGKV